MIIRVVELCCVDTNEENPLREIIYESQKEDLLSAFEDYENNFDFDKMISSEDNFLGECSDTIKCVSVEDITDRWYNKTF